MFSHILPNRIGAGFYPNPFIMSHILCHNVPWLDGSISNCSYHNFPSTAHPA